MENKNVLLIFKNGNFYNCYQDDAIIMKYLFDYKINKDNKCGFPDNAFNKVINKLEDMKIDYQVIYKDKNPLIKKYNNFNNYSKALKKALEYINIKERVERIIEKINEITDIDKLNNIVRVIESEV